jgi:hypothetical protein
LLALSRLAPGLDSLKESNAMTKTDSLPPVTPRMEQKWPPNALGTYERRLFYAVLAQAASDHEDDRTVMALAMRWSARSDVDGIKQKAPGEQRGVLRNCSGGQHEASLITSCRCSVNKKLRPHRGQRSGHPAASFRKAAHIVGLPPETAHRRKHPSPRGPCAHRSCCPWPLVRPKG